MIQFLFQGDSSNNSLIGGYSIPEEVRDQLNNFKHSMEIDAVVGTSFEDIMECNKSLAKHALSSAEVNISLEYLKDIDKVF